MGIKIVTAKIRNDGSMIYCLGDTNLIPGAPAKDVDRSLLDHFEVKEGIKRGHLTVVEGGKDEIGKALEDMTVAELKAYAAENNIDLGGATKKEDILAVIQKDGE